MTVSYPANALTVPLMALACWLAQSATLAQAGDDRSKPTSYSPAVSRHYPTQVYWGDTHLHTNLSWDAYNFGNTKLGPEEAYCFAKGEVVTAHNGMPVQLSRPLDFLVIADHASNMGVMNGLARNEASLLRTPLGQRWVDKLNNVKQLLITDTDAAKKTLVRIIRRGFYGRPCW